jgi:hypothetical protein
MLIEIIFPIKGPCASIIRTFEGAWSEMLGIDMAFLSCLVAERTGSLALWPMAY